MTRATVLRDTFYCSVVVLFAAQGCAKNENNNVGQAPPETGRVSPSDTARNLPPPTTSEGTGNDAELKQGTIRLSASDSGHYGVRKGGDFIGDTPVAVSQRFGTRQVYSILDANGKTMCVYDVEVRSPHETKEYVCNPNDKRTSP